MDDTLDGLLAHLDPIPLGEMESVALLDRADTKYLLPAARLPGLLAGLGGDYRVLEVGGRRDGSYETIYFDTDTLTCYRRHHSGRAVRVKVRARRYASTGACFVEVKRRDNHGRTIKRRLSVGRLPATIGGESADFVREASGLEPDSLLDTLRVDYRRATLVGRRTNERVTIDGGLTFQGADPSRFAGLVIVEVKRPGVTVPSAVVRRLHGLGVVPGGVSKYCLGMIATRPGIPRNNFLESLRHLDRVLHAAG